MNDLRYAANLILEGKIVAFPTETVYGLGADLFNSEAIERLFLLKQRDKAKSFIAHIADINEVSSLSDEIPDQFYELANRFWPGPLTMVIKKRGGGTIAVRMPDNSMTRQLIRLVGHPIAGTSANLSGEKPLTNALQIRETFKEIAYVIDGGDASQTPSTIVSLINGFEVLRVGVISEEKLAF